MNLREEIFLSSNRFTKSYHKTHELTNEILSIFEKRIDELTESNFYPSAAELRDDIIKEMLK